MNIRIFHLILLSFVLGIIFSGCATSSAYKEGIIVNVFEPPQTRTGSLQCNDKNFVMSYIYVGEDSVHGNIKKSEKKLISSFAKAALKETSFITPVENKYMPGYDDKIYPIMSINVIKNSIKVNHPREDTIEKKGYFTAQIDIKVPGSSVVCSSTEPISIELSYKMPTYESNKLPSNAYIQERIVKDAIKKAVASFVPIRETIFRPVLSGSGVIEKSAQMLNNNNCEMAKDMLENYIKDDKQNSKAYYNLGVSYECLAKSCDINEAEPLLEKAINAYTKAAEIKPDNKLYNRARKDIKEQIRILKAVSKKSIEVKSYIKSFN